jgi:copper chaperone CopZ
MTRTFSVPGISCGHCKAAIEGELATTPGVERAEVDIEAKTVAVDGPVTDEQITAAIAEAGYDVAGASA